MKQDFKWTDELVSIFAEKYHKAKESPNSYLGDKDLVESFKETYAPKVEYKEILSNTLNYSSSAAYEKFARFGIKSAYDTSNFWFEHGVDANKKLAGNVTQLIHHVLVKKELKEELAELLEKTILDFSKKNKH